MSVVLHVLGGSEVSGGRVGPLQRSKGQTLASAHFNWLYPNSQTIHARSCENSGLLTFPTVPSQHQNMILIKMWLL